MFTQAVASSCFVKAILASSILLDVNSNRLVLGGCSVAVYDFGNNKRLYYKGR